MTGPDNAEVAIDVDGETWVLRYPCGALMALQVALKDESDIAGASALISRLSTKNLAVFVWCGRLHSDRLLDLEKVREAVEWSEVPVADWATAVLAAWTFAVEGSMPDAEIPPGKAEATKPRRGRILRRLWSELFRSRRTSSGGDGPSPTATLDSSPSSA